MRRSFSVAVFVRVNEVAPRILVVKHKRLGTWLPVGGEMEAGETPLEAAKRELNEETGLQGKFSRLAFHCDGVPDGYIGYEEHVAGSKGLHMNFVFMCEVSKGSIVVPNHEFEEFQWIGPEELEQLESPLNVREFGERALSATVKES